MAQPDRSSTRLATFPSVRPALVASLLALLLAAPAAIAGPLQDFRRDGQINPCRYSDGQLRNQLNGLPPDVQQYAPGLADQLAAGREGCGGNGGSSNAGRSFEAVPLPGAVGGEGGGGGPDAAPAKARVPTPPAPEPAARDRLADVASPAVGASATGSDAPGWLLPLLAITSLVAVAVGLARFSGVGVERLARPVGASFEEAGGRTADALAGLRDLVRVGR